jgi:hypothetical protein
LVAPASKPAVNEEHLAAEIDASSNVESAAPKKTSIQDLQVMILLQSAARLEKQGALLFPKGENAVEKYRRVLALQPHHPSARQQLKQIILQVEQQKLSQQFSAEKLPQVNAILSQLRAEYAL